MRSLVLLSAISGGILAGFLILIAFLPAEFQLQRTIRIQQPIDVVFQELNSFQNRKKWDPWIRQEPKAITEVSGPVRGVGAIWKWKGQRIGSGTLKIIKTKENQRIFSTIEYGPPQDSKADISWQLQTKQEATEVTWTISIPLAYPFQRIFGLFLEEIVGPQYEKGLKNLKEYLEK